MYRVSLCLFAIAGIVGCEAASDSVAPVSTEGGNSGLAAASARTVDPTRLDPPLSTNFDWKCHLQAGGEPVCIGQGPSPDNTDGWAPVDPEAWACSGGALIYHDLSAQGIGKRHYNADYQLVERDVHWFGRDRFSLSPDGSGATASGELNFFDTFVFGVPADESTITETLRGTDSKAATDQPPHELVFLNKGELRFTPNGALEVVSGRWDFVNDFEGAIQRLCAALQ